MSEKEQLYLREKYFNIPFIVWEDLFATYNDVDVLETLLMYFNAHRLNIIEFTQVVKGIRKTRMQGE